MQSKEKKWNGVALEFLLAIATLVINKLFFFVMNHVHKLVFKDELENETKCKAKKRK